MKAVTNNFLKWLMGLTTIMRYLVIAVLLHVAILLGLGTIKIAEAVPQIFAQFTGGELPPPSDDMPDDPYAALRDFEYKGPDLGGGLGGPGDGGNPDAGGQQYNAEIQAATEAPPNVGEVIGVFSDAATAINRPAAAGPSLGSAPVTGVGDALKGAAGIKGAGGMWLGAGRIGPKRTANLNQFGGSKETERAVLAALRWLKANQKPDGSWVLRNDAGTALGVLCFLGHGENADSPEFGPTVQKALERLARAVQKDGNVAGAMYEQALVTLALSEGFMLTSSPMLRDPLDRATKYLLRAQKAPKQNPIHIGGWRYSANDNTSDVSVSGWVLMAIKSSKSAGVEVPQEAFDAAAKYFWNMYHPTGGFGYDSPGNSGNLTPVGVLSQQFLGNGKDNRVDKCLDNLRKTKMEWENPESWALYRWYYTTLAMFQGGAQNWTYWNRQMREALLKSQHEDGHWDLPEKSAEKGHVADGKVYTTCMATLMLEVYYRYLPIYQLIDVPVAPKTPTLPPTGGAAKT